MSTKLLKPSKHLSSEAQDEINSEEVAIKHQEKGLALNTCRRTIFKLEGFFIISLALWVPAGHVYFMHVYKYYACTHSDSRFYSMNYHLTACITQSCSFSPVKTLGGYLCSLLGLGWR